jgi:hypothetical protein
MERPVRSWRAVQLVGLAAMIGVAPLLYDMMQTEFAGEVPSWSFVAAIVGFAALGIPFVLSLQFVRRSPGVKWSRPSWRVLDPRQPLQIFDYSGWLFITLGLSVAAYTAWIGSNNFLFVLPLLVGVGVLVGVRLSILMFRSKLLEQGENDDAA